MSDTKQYSFIFPVSFWAFVVTKVMGTTFAAWSWFWALLPVVPVFWAIFVKYLGW